MKTRPTTILLTDDLKRKAKIKCAKLGTDLSKVIRKLLQDWVDDEDD